MLEHLVAPQNLPFAVALLITVALGTLELVTTLFGAALSHALDSLLPDFDVDADLDADMHMDVGTGADLHVPHADAGAAGDALSGLARGLDWLHVGRVPALILLLVALGSFGGFGLLLQSFAHSTWGELASPWLVALPAAVLGLVSVRVLGGAFARVIPKEETSAVSRDSFLGMPALVTAGIATRGNPAQAKLHDEHGQVHYVLVEPEHEGVELPAGVTVILKRQEGAVFKAAINEAPELMLDRHAR